MYVFLEINWYSFELRIMCRFENLKKITESKLSPNARYPQEIF